MDEVFSKLNEDEVKTLVKYMRQADIVASGGVTGTQPPPRLELLPVEFKLDGPATYLSWSCRIIGGLARRSLDNYLTGEEKEPLVKMSNEWKAWRATHMFVYTWHLNSMVPSIATTVDGILSVTEIWEKLQKISAGRGNNMRVFQIE